MKGQKEIASKAAPLMRFLVNVKEKYCVTLSKSSNQ